MNYTRFVYMVIQYSERCVIPLEQRIKPYVYKQKVWMCNHCGSEFPDSSYAIGGHFFYKDTPISEFEPYDCCDALCINCILKHKDNIDSFSECGCGG